MQKNYFVYVGTYSENLGFVDGTSKGIYQFRFDSDTGNLTPVSYAKSFSPSYLAIAPNGRNLYAVQETSAGNKNKPGIHAFSIDPTNGALTHLNFQPSHGEFPCHVAIDATESCVIVANYGTGNLAIFPILADGRLDTAVQIIQHTGSGPNKMRQEGPHAHMTAFDAARQLAFVCDLGLDKVMIYQLDPALCKLIPHDPPFTAVAPGSGPRHFALHPNGRYAFVINEMASTITVCEYAGNTLTPCQNISTLPSDFSDESTTAAIKIAPKGKFIYGSNRGHDSIAVFAFDSEKGQLTAVDHTPTQGKTPRDFAIDASGQWLLAANQDSNSITIFRIDQETGKLQFENQITTPTPVCINLFPK